MALTAEEQDLFDFAKNALPGWMPDADEFLFGAAKMFGSVRAMHDYFFGQTLIGDAVGATATTPDWLAQHARDRGTGRRLGEDDPTLRDRLRNVPEALTRASILAAANAILAASGVVGSAVMVELPRDAAHFGTYTSMTGVGGEFTAPAGAGDVQRFTPDAGWATPPVDSTHTGYPWDSWRITTMGAANPGNDVAADIDGTDGDPALDIVDNAVSFQNPTGVADVDPTVAWTVAKYVHPPWIADGFARSYISRGYRITRTRPPTIVVILPYGTTSAIASSVAEMVRQKKAAGIIARIEWRQTPP